jgi:hypothetical protein
LSLALPGQRMQLVSSPTPRVCEVCADAALEIPDAHVVANDHQFDCRCALSLSCVSIRAN